MKKAAGVRKSNVEQGLTGSKEPPNKPLLTDGPGSLAPLGSAVRDRAVDRSATSQPKRTRSTPRAAAPRILL
jgi:hypothetical protein